MLESDRLVCEKNATKAQPVTNCNLGSINYIYFNYKVNLLIGRGKILQHYQFGVEYESKESQQTDFNVIMTWEFFLLG